MPEFARLSTFLRAHGHVSHPNDKFLDNDDDIVEKKREAEVIKRRLLAKRKAEEDGIIDEDDGRPLFGANIPYHNILREIKVTDEEFKHLVRRDPGQTYSLRGEIDFDYKKKIPESSNLFQSLYSVTWLEEQLSIGGGLPLPPAEFALTLVELLASERSSDDLQAELFDLLGFDRIDLIQNVLEHRSDIVKSHQINKKMLKYEIANSAAANSNIGGADQQNMPSFGPQVIVQSEDEKQLKKQVRKEEKRLHKLLKNTQEDSDDDEFDPKELVLSSSLAQAALSNVMHKPLIKSKEKSPVVEIERYPFVWDSYAEAKLSAGFIQGVKMALPKGFERMDDKKSEEVFIPASDKAPINVGKNLVAVSSLDYIGQMVFQGIKNLNRIQSVVFDSAYRTNENLLVCAPTGAGKTNVAMLCIAQTIRQFLEGDVIKKDAFKIVYVAPMKALAAEMTANFGKRLAPLGLTVKELTGDMQLTKTEIMQTQMLVTTPEKWDVVTRKPGDVSLSQLVRLLIIDEVHLLHGDRGPVIEALVARTLRMVESSQTVIRVVGLSATLPNYIDVAQFLRVNPYLGLFFFDGRFRPVPLAQTFIGVKALNSGQQANDTNEICYEKVLDFVRKGHQVMVFVHARNATVKTAMKLLEEASNRGKTEVFLPNDSPQYGVAQKSISKSRNKQLVELFNGGFGIHHAGMLRSDRSLVEKLFGQGFIKVLVCTATLAWGVNLPAHAVIIKGTEIYNAKQGGFVDVGILDVLQIFGRAGRPQFDTSGHGTIITSHDKLSHYLSLLTNQFPIESNFVALLADNLNAEISLGTVTNVEEAVQWLSYTYLYVRMRKNPLVYGMKYAELKEDPLLDIKRTEIIRETARKLDRAKMIRFDERTGYLFPTDLGRTASQYYIKYDTIEVFNEILKPVMNEGELIAMLSKATEFEQQKVRDEEMDELDDLTHEYCQVPVSGGSENVHGKVNILIQNHISRGSIRSFSLISDSNYVITNASRISRALFEIVLRKNWPLLAGRLLKLAKSIERQMWDFETPLRQHPNIKPEMIHKLESRNFTIDKIRELDAKEVGHLLHHPKAGFEVKKAAFEIPILEIEASIQPITRTVLRVRLNLTANFRWYDRVHGSSEPFWIWVEDPVNNHIYHHEYYLITKKHVVKKEIPEVVFTIPIFEPLPTQYYVRAISDRWLGSETYCTISFQHLILPEKHPPHTNLLDLQPLPKTALDNPELQMLFKFDYFNPIQSQIFHTLYHSDKNVLLGAPTGSGKTIAAEIAMFKVFRDYPDGKIVYIAPMKALVRERITDWKVRLQEKLKKPVIELTGDITPDVQAIKKAKVIVTTPEKWDAVSRSWQTRSFVQAVRLIVIDEIHLLGEDRGPVLEVIVSRTNFISSHTSNTLRVIGLSTALANAKDLADWLGIDSQMGLFNFRPSVRPVPLEVHISGYPGKHYCPRMATMNKPTYQAIQQHSPTKPALVFVSSRRQTRMTALDLIAFLAGEDNPKMWLHMDEGEMERLALTVKDQNLKLTLAFGIGMHHAGLVEKDRQVVEELFVNQKIQILIATATVAWGVNFPAHLVVVKGTEYFDPKQKRYVDMPITDVLQMMGRAGRPQFDDHGVACVLVHDVKKHFYKKFLYEPFPVESSLLQVLPDHLNAEIVAGTITTKQEALDYMTWTFFFRRLVQNPTYYGLDGVNETNINGFLTQIVDKALTTLNDSFCVEYDDDDRSLIATTMGRIASYYYLSHSTVQHFKNHLCDNMSVEDVIDVLCDATEFDQLPVRHNEENLNADLAKLCPLEIVCSRSMESPNTKTFLLLQAHFSRLTLPCSDYYTDLKSVLDQTIRILQAMIDVSAESGWLTSTLRIMNVMQMVVQARWIHDSPFLMLPRVEHHMLHLFRKRKLEAIPQLWSLCNKKVEPLASILRQEMDESHIDSVFEAVHKFPNLAVEISITVGENASPVEVPKRNSKWFEAEADTECTLLINLKRLNKLGYDEKAFAPKFPKPQPENWFLALGDIENQQDILAMKRVSTIRGNSTQQLNFWTPEDEGRVILTLYVMSDSYIGLDQQYDINLEVVKHKKHSHIEVYECDKK